MLRASLLAASLSGAAAQWEILAANIGTIATGVAFTDATTGYIPIDNNGQGVSIQKSTDGGITWNDDETGAPFALLLLDIAAHGSNIAVVGALSLEYSLNSAVTFNTSLGPLGAGQCMRVIGDGQGFAAVGQWGLVKPSNGPAISKDFGITFEAMNIPELTADARYGAFPTADAWFIAAGDWPGEDNPQCDNPPCGTEGLVSSADYTPAPAHGSVLVKRQGARVHLLREPSGKHVWGLVKRGRLHAANHPGRALQPINNWEAQIATTVDAGKTWKLAFSQIGQFYFNDIECTTDQNCCVVAEAQDSNATAGTYIYCTSDGGSTWVDNYRNADPDSSLIGIAAAGPNELWAIGGEEGAGGFKGPSFFHTLDGGATWTKATTPLSMLFQYAIDITCTAGNCWALLLDVLTQETSLASLKNGTVPW